MIFPNAAAAETVRSYFERRVLCVGSRRQTPRGATDIYAANRQPGKEEIVEPEETIAYQPITCALSSQPYRTEFLLLLLRYVFYPSKFGAFYVYFQPVSPARTA